MRSGRPRGCRHASAPEPGTGDPAACIPREPRAARRADGPPHPPAHADASRRARSRVSPDVGRAATASPWSRPSSPSTSRSYPRSSASCCRACSTKRATVSPIPRIALRHRLQHDVHGLDRSRHRVLGEDGHLVVELDRHGAATPQVLGAVMAAAALPGSSRGAVLDAIRRVVNGRWARPRRRRRAARAVRP